MIRIIRKIVGILLISLIIFTCIIMSLKLINKEHYNGNLINILEREE